MLNILCVCGNGMGTSTILKINVKKICDENGIDATVESCAFSEAMTYLGTTDLILTSRSGLRCCLPTMRSWLRL